MLDSHCNWHVTCTSTKSASCPHCSLRLQAIGLIRRGGVIGRVGLPHDVEISAEGTFYGNIGIKGGPAPVRHYDLDEGLLDAVLKGEINPGRVFTAEYDLDHIQDAYEAMDQRKVIKALIRF